MERCLNSTLWGCCLLLFSFQLQGNEERQWTIRGFAQGTTYHITYYAADGVVAQHSIDSLLNALDSSFSIYKPYSLISRFNQSNRGIRADGHLLKLLAASAILYRQTDGLSDVTVKPLVDAWGFGAAPADSEPSATGIATLLAGVGFRKIRVQGDSLVKTNPQTQLDLNGIGQGYAVDVLAEWLDKKGIGNYLVELGGEVRIKGSKPDGNRFRIGIASVKTAVADDYERIVVPDEGGLTTSGNYRRFRMAGGQKISHIINPLTGYPVQNEMVSVTVWAPDATTADGYDNAFMAMGLQATLAFLHRRTDMGAFIIYQKPDGTFADTASAVFHEHVKPATYSASH